MSFAASSLKTFRSCTAAISTRSLARPAVGRYPTRLARLGVRCYSEEKTPSEEPKEGASKEPKGECSELEAKLKAKEGEVTDLTVNIFQLAVIHSSHEYFRVGYVIYKLTSSTCSAMLRERRSKRATLQLPSSLATCWRRWTS